MSMETNTKPVHPDFSPLDKAEKKILRSSIFRHLDGIAIAPTAFALSKRGVLQYLLENKSVSLNQISQVFKANEGYLNGYYLYCYKV